VVCIVRFFLGGLLLTLAVSGVAPSEWDRGLEPPAGFRPATGQVARLYDRFRLATLEDAKLPGGSDRPVDKLKAIERAASQSIDSLFLHAQTDTTLLDQLRLLTILCRAHGWRAEPEEPPVALAGTSHFRDKIVRRRNQLIAELNDLNLQFSSRPAISMRAAYRHVADTADRYADSLVAAGAVIEQSVIDVIRLTAIYARSNGGVTHLTDLELLGSYELKAMNAHFAEALEEKQEGNDARADSLFQLAIEKGERWRQERLAGGADSLSLSTLDRFLSRARGNSALIRTHVLVGRFNTLIRRANRATQGFDQCEIISALAELSQVVHGAERLRANCDSLMNTEWGRQSPAREELARLQMETTTLLELVADDEENALVHLLDCYRLLLHAAQSSPESSAARDRLETETAHLDSLLRSTEMIPVVRDRLGELLQAGRKLLLDDSNAAQSP